MARVEWALHAAATAADRWPSTHSFALLQTADPTGLRLLLAPGACLVPSPWPVVSVVTAHTRSQPALDVAWRRCRERAGETALVWRAGLQPTVARVEPAAAALLESLLHGADLPQALDAACARAEDPEAPFDFSTWLTTAVQTGLVLGATLAPPTEPPQEDLA